jgi:hypothetical protein
LAKPALPLRKMLRVVKLLAQKPHNIVVDAVNMSRQDSNPLTLAV